MLKHIYNRLQLLASSGTLNLITGNKAQVQVLDEEVLNNIKRVTPFGFAHQPKSGSQVYMMFPGGDRSFGIALIVGDSRYQIELAEGEVALHDDKGNHVHLKQDGTIEIKASAKVLADAPEFETTGNVTIGGNLLVNGDITATGTITGG